MERRNLLVGWYVCIIISVASITLFCAAGDVSIKVVDSRTGASLSSATVFVAKTVTTACDTNITSKTTDMNGEVLFLSSELNVANGTILCFKVSKVGYIIKGFRKDLQYNAEITPDVTIDDDADGLDTDNNLLIGLNSLQKKMQQEGRIP